MSIAEEYEALAEQLAGPVEDYDDEPVQLEVRDQDGANRHLRHVARIRRELADAEEVIAAEQARLTAWAEERRARAAREEAWHLGILENYARACLALNPKLKTIKLPEGDLTLRAQDPEWAWEKDGEVFRDWCLEHHPELLHPQAPAPPRKVALVEAKKALTVTVGKEKVYGVFEGGEIPPGVKATVREEKFDIRLAEG